MFLIPDGQQPPVPGRGHVHRYASLKGQSVAPSHADRVRHVGFVSCTVIIINKTTVAFSNVVCMVVYVPVP